MKRVLVVLLGYSVWSLKLFKARHWSVNDWNTFFQNFSPLVSKRINEWFTPFACSAIIQKHQCMLGSIRVILQIEAPSFFVQELRHLLSMAKALLCRLWFPDPQAILAYWWIFISIEMHGFSYEYLSQAILLTIQSSDSFNDAIIIFALKEVCVKWVKREGIFCHFFCLALAVYCTLQVKN